MGYRLNRLDEPVFMAVSKPLLNEFGIHYRLESCCVAFSQKIAFVGQKRQFNYHNSPIYDECQTQSAWVLTLP